MNDKFIRFKATDNIELCGILYSPKEKSKKTVVHVHGLAGNFYENRFISYLAKLYTNKGYNFLTFNNRGHGYFSDLLKWGDKVSFINGGGVYESFEESIFDIEGVINYLKNQGNEEIILQGHSYGCNKIINYYIKKKDKNISKIILLAPCDIVLEIKVCMGDKYDKCINQAKDFIKNNKPKKLIDSPLFPITFTAETFVNNWLENTMSDIFRYRLDNDINEDLKQIDIPILIEIGEKDNFVLVADKEQINSYFKNNLKNYTINYILDAKHNYLNSEELLVKDIDRWLD